MLEGNLQLGTVYLWMYRACGIDSRARRKDKTLSGTSGIEEMIALDRSNT